MLLTITLLLGAYIVGAIPTGYWFTKYFFGHDITAYGSKNIGATNVARVLKSNKYFVLIFMLDMGKAFGYCYAAQCCEAQITLVPPLIVYYLVGAMLLLGNAYSIFIQFKGGKGVSTSVGILLALAPYQLALIFIATWFCALIIFRVSGIPALFAIMVTAVCAKIFGSSWALLPGFLYFLTFLVIWLLFRHYKNIRAFLMHD